MFKFIHAADIHLDSPLHGLERYEGAPVAAIRNATREALQNLVQLAMDEEAAFLLVSGDLYDGDWKDYNTGLFFVKQMSRLREAHIPAFIAAGNHDAASRITRNLRLPENVHLFSSRKPETRLVENPPAAIHGRSFPMRAVQENLAVDYPEPVPDRFNIGLLHTCLDGREGHEPYAPCSLEDLLAKRYDYWALGHVHGCEVLHRNPWVAFSGNIQGRNIRETGPRGCLLVTVDDAGTAAVEHRTLDVLRWSLLEIDAAAAAQAEEIVERAALAIKAEASSCEGRMLAVRIRVTGASPAHADLLANPERWVNEMRACALDCGDVWVEKVQFRTSLPLDLEQMSKGPDAVGDLLRFMNTLSADPQMLASLADDLAPLRSKLPSELLHGEDPVGLEGPNQLRDIVEDARQLLVSRLLGREDG